MPGITITISEEAYRMLKAAKKKDESFSDVILRVFPLGHPLRILSYLQDRKPLGEAVAESIRKASNDLWSNQARIPAPSGQKQSGRRRRRK